MRIDGRALVRSEIQEVNAVIDKYHSGIGESKSTTDKEEYVQSSSGPDAIELINGGEEWIITDRNESGAVYYRDGGTLHVACHELFEVCARFSPLARIRPLTPQEADAEFDASPAIPLSAEEINRIVEFATSEDTRFTYRVQMLAFGDPGEVREVQIPPGPADNRDIEGILDLVYYWGQNDFQPQEHPSVSAGDVIEVGSDKYLIKNVGFRKLTEKEYQEYLVLPRRERSFHTLVNN